MKRTRLRKVSKKQSARLAKYRELVQERIGSMLWDVKCEISGMRGPIEPHHPKGRTGANLFYFKLIHKSLHRQIHENPNWARKMGYLE